MYHLLDTTSRPRRWIGDTPYIDDVDWWEGKVITIPIPDPLPFELKKYQPASPDQDQYMGVFIYTNPPVWRDDFIQTLRECGVNNFDTYNVAISDPDDDTVHTNYKAVNILGLVAAADMKKSIATVHDGIPLIDVDFDELVVDEKKADGILLFRLAESTNSILVHEKLRDALLAKGYGTDLAFYDLKDAAV